MRSSRFTPHKPNLHNFPRFEFADCLYHTLLEANTIGIIKSEIQFTDRYEHRTIQNSSNTETVIELELRVS